MTEKKTFKNPYGAYDTASVIHNGWDLQETADLEPAHFFNSDEWDMEVTFTRKPFQFKPGTRVRSKYTTTYTYEVLAQWKDTVIVVDPTDDEIEYFDYDDLVIIS